MTLATRPVWLERPLGGMDRVYRLHKWSGILAVGFAVSLNEMGQGLGAGARFKLVANLPYNIATPVVSNLLSTEIVPDLMAVTIQKELADRMTAAPRTKDYGALSIWLQSQCTGNTNTLALTT